MSLRRTIQAYHHSATNEHHRYRSWEHCYSYFRRARAAGIDTDHAALQLGFYLASWGMYRGSSFLLQYTYTVHRPVIGVLCDRRFDRLWSTDVGTTDTDHQLIPVILDLVIAIRHAYKPFAPTRNSNQPTDTLVTKVILGTFGCLPACDRYFVDGAKLEALKYSRLDASFIQRLLYFCNRHLPALQREQAGIAQSCGLRYPLMKLIDMHFWQIGYEKRT